MSSEHCQIPYKQRFKGVETFLRRVAFNLGNTASQTEVKIVSCIPIDVTDLQQKIINLEKQLHDAQQQAATVDERVTENPKDKPSAVVNSALYGSTFAKESSMVSFCSNKPTDKIKPTQLSTFCEDCSFRMKKSNVSFGFPHLSAPDTKHAYNFSTSKGRSNETTAAIERCKNIFRKRKGKKDYKRNKMKTHLVYYAQETAENPFKVNNVPLKCNEIRNNNDALCMSYLNNVIRKQYDPKKVIEEFSDTSHFSRPICRDMGDKYELLDHYEFDACSCCHGKFQNIDNYITKTDYNSILTKLHNPLDNTKLYYDSNHYDLIPVKENSHKVIKNNVDRKKENNMSVEIKCWPEHLRTKQRHHPYIVNYQTKIPADRRRNTRPQVMLSEKNKSQKLNTNRGKTKKTDQQTSIDTSKSCCVDCSNIYPKRLPQQAESKINKTFKNIFTKNESVATDEVRVKLELNSQSTQLELNAIEDCRDITLNQIKKILQSVLEEVKTSTKLNNDVTKKDAIVQKAASQNSMPGDSTLLHSYTYNNSYNTNSCVASCSKQIPHEKFCLANVSYQPVKYLQNFPVFIQPTSGRHMCACYYRKSSYKPQNRQATATATNTDKDIEISSSKETEKLIKEIYKSIALNMDFPTKDSSKSEYIDLKSENISTNTIENENKGVSNEKGIKVEATVSPIQSIIGQNNFECVTANTQSDLRKLKIKPLYKKAGSTGNINKDKCVHRLELHSNRGSDTIVEDDEQTDEFSDENDSDETVIIEDDFKQNRKIKKGFFNRMLKSIKLFKKNKQTRPEIEEVSDSDDYETIYSEKSAAVSPRLSNEAKGYTKVHKYGRDDGYKEKRSPYLEQEYRRQWNEKLTFHEQDSKCSSERPVSRPMFWGNYEARSAVVGHKLPNQLNPANMEEETTRINVIQKNNKERLGWLKKRKLGINCGEQWKKFILEN